jgi:hypothetical protein
MSDLWPQEEIPNDALLYMRTHRMHIDKSGELQPGVFCDHPKLNGAMSTNWQKYCPSPEQCRSMAKKPDDNGVISLVVQDVREIPLDVYHTPSYEFSDRSHTDVTGEKTTKVRLRLLKAFSWCLRLPK